MKQETKQTDGKEVLQDKYTKGEWKAVELMKPNDSRYKGIYIQTEKKFIAELQPYGSDFEETKANAALICEAVNERQSLIDSNRELLDALKQFVHAVEHEGQVHGRIVDAVRNAKTINNANSLNNK